MPTPILTHSRDNWRPALMGIKNTSPIEGHG